MRRAIGTAMALVIVASAATSWAQNATGGIDGRTIDPFADAVAGAEVIAESVSGYLQNAESDRIGAFEFTALAPGQYRVTATREGFRSAEEQVEVVAGYTSRPRLMLTPNVPASLTVRAVDPQGLALPGVVVQTTGPTGRTREGVTGNDGSYGLSPVRPGTWRVRGTLDGFSATEGTTETSFGNEAEVGLQLALDYTLRENVMVLGSQRPVGRRTEVRAVDSPITTSVISASMLETTGATNIGDVLRTVPGVNVIQMSARDVQLTSRHSTGLLANSQLVLMDGRSLYLDFWGMVLWDMLPANTGDIQQIEVVRGPASATWGANAMTGAVHVLTKAPRESIGTSLTLTGGLVDRNTGSTSGDGHQATLFGANASIRRAPTDRLAYRVSAGYFTTPTLPRPTGRVPLIEDPRMPGATVGGAPYPDDSRGGVGLGYLNQGTTQPKFDARVDQELGNGATLTYAGGISGTEGITHTGVGPFDIERGSYLGYARLGYTQGALRVQAFTNVFDANAPNLILPNPDNPTMPIVFDFHSKTFDIDIGHSTTAGKRHVLNYGGNVRRNTFNLGVTPAARDRTEVGGYIQDEIFLDPFRIVLGGRIDKFGSVSRPFVSPRLALMYKPGRNHSLTLSYNRAFRSPSLIENYLDMRLIQPIDLSGLAALRPLLPQLLPPGLSREDAARALAGLEYQLDETTSRPFPLITRVAGNEVRVGDERRRNLDQESLTATELSYTGMFPSGTTVGAAVYRNRRDGQIKGGPLDPSLDPYTVDNPPPGWLLPPQILGTLAQFGSVLPRTALSFFNRGPTADVGTELWFDQQLSDSLSAAASYSWQGKPRVLDADDPFPANELSLPPTHRLNVSTTLNSRRFIASAAMSTATRAFWSDVLTPEFHGYSKGYKMINGSFGVKWANGTITTMLKVTNLLNDSIQQHIFGDILRRTVSGEVRFEL